MSKRKTDCQPKERRVQPKKSQQDDLGDAITALHQTIAKLNRAIDRVQPGKAAEKNLLAHNTVSRVLH